MQRLFTSDRVWIPTDVKPARAIEPAAAPDDTTWDNLPPWDYPDGKPIKKTLLNKVDRSFIERHARVLFNKYRQIHGIGNVFHHDRIYNFACHIVMCGKKEYDSAMEYPNIYSPFLKTVNYHDVARWLKLKL
jgi:hypothetical protein